MNISEYCVTDINWRPKVGQILVAKLHDQPWHINRNVYFAKVTGYKKGCKTFKVELMNVYWWKEKQMETWQIGQLSPPTQEEVERTFYKPLEVGEKAPDGFKVGKQIFQREQVCRWNKKDDKWIVIVKSVGEAIERFAIQEYKEDEKYFV